ncbi:MAG: NYN domain-containing protein [Egibacteraceae bacterium]
MPCKPRTHRRQAGAFAEFLVTATRHLVRTYYYSAPVHPDSTDEAKRAQQKFFGALHRTAYMEIRLGRLVRRDVRCEACGDHHQRYVEKGVDMYIGVDMLAGASKNLYDVAVLVTGDGDLIHAVKAVKDLGKHVELATFPIGRSDELASVADVITELSLANLKPLFIRP